MAAITVKTTTYTFIVARYSPPGNIYGTFGNNVKNLGSKTPCRICPSKELIITTLFVPQYNSSSFPTLPHLHYHYIDPFIHTPLLTC